MKEQQNNQDFMTWLKAQIPDTPEMQAIAQAESEHIEQAFAFGEAKGPQDHNRKSLRSLKGRVK